MHSVSQLALQKYCAMYILEFGVKGTGASPTHHSLIQLSSAILLRISTEGRNDAQHSVHIRKRPYYPSL